MSPICYAGLHDPTRPPGYEGEEGRGSEGFVVNQVLVSPARRMAAVNGKTVKVGDTIEGAQVVAISSKGVTFHDKQGEYTIYLLKQRVKGLSKGEKFPKG